MTAKVLSLIFTPYYLPLSGLVVLFSLSYLSLLPAAYKWQLGILVYIFTILLPALLIRLYCHSQGLSRIQVFRKEHRIIPYMITIVMYLLCYYILGLLHSPHFIGSVLIGALLIQVVCALINVWWDASIHTAAIGGVAGALLAFAIRLSFNPIGWFAVVMLLGGLVGSSRIILRQHTLWQVVAGFLVGLVCSFLVVGFF